jgi:hypothetical protein
MPVRLSPSTRERLPLQEQLKALKDEEMIALEKLLTDAQKQRLKELKTK